MALREQQNLLARLYTDGEFRARFLGSPASAAAEFDLEEAEADELARVAADEVRWFADSLFHKRYREAAKLLPLSKLVLGDRLETKFREFSKGFNPTSVKKHLEDALAFSRDLTADRQLDGFVRDVVRFESARLRHNAERRRLSVCRLRYDLRPLIHGRVVTEPRKRLGFAVWIRFGEGSGFYLL